MANKISNQIDKTMKTFVNNINIGHFNHLLPIVNSLSVNKKLLILVMIMIL
jgi:hypothetical protein